MVKSKLNKKKTSKDKFPIQYDRHLNSISRLVKKHKHKHFVGHIFNLLEGATSVERQARQLPKDYNLTFRLIDEIKDANAELYKDLSDETFNKVTDLFAELNYLVSQRLHSVQVALYHNREIPFTKLRAMPLRKPKTRSKVRRKAKRGVRHGR